MRIHGTLVKWNDERGFGFIAPASGNDEIFVHVSAFPRDGVRPHIGELISFETENRTDGRKRAIRIMRPAVRSRQPLPQASARTRSSLVTALGLMALGSLAIYAFLSPGNPATRQAPVDTVMPAVPLLAPAQLFSCDGRTRCSQMTSCEEAQFFLKNCPNTQMDGDQDGVPCEHQWCG